MEAISEQYGDRVTRIQKALAMEKPDKTPVSFCVDTFCCKHMGASMAKFSSDLNYQTEVKVNSLKQFPVLDTTELAVTYPDLMAVMFNMKMKIAGREFPEGAHWQLDEQERVTESDYDIIIDKGYNAWFGQFAASKLGVDLGAMMEKMAIASMAAHQKFAEIGLPVLTEMCPAQGPIEVLGGGRTLSKLIRDPHRIPDKVRAVMDIMTDEAIMAMKGMLAAMPVKPMTMFIGNARTASEFFSPKMSERFVFPYIRKIANAIISEGILVNLHNDSNWDRDLGFYKEFPKGSCMYSCDSATDIYKVKEVLGDHFCIKGDVPPGLLSVGTPDEVYNYCTKLIKDMGDGFILAPGCTLPMNTKLENLDALFRAASGK